MRPDNSANYLVSYDEQFANRAKKTRCRRCGQRSHESLTICPSCGRALRAAVSRWITWGIPLVLAALLYVSVWGISGRSPLAWAIELPQRISSMATNLGVLIEPRLMDPETVLSQQATAKQDAALSGSANSVAIVTALPAEQPMIELLPDQPADMQIALQNVGKSLEGNSQNEQSQNEQPLAAAFQSTSTPIPLPQSTDALSVQAPTASERAASTAINLPEPAIEPTAQPTAQPTLQPTTQPTAQPTATSVPQTDYRSEPLVLQSPAAGATVDCAQENSLSWQEPISVTATDQYMLHLGYVSGQSADQYIVTWIAKQKFSIDETSWVLDRAYCKLAPDEYQNQWIWYMQVIDENDKIISAPSSTSYFVWRKPS